MHLLTMFKFYVFIHHLKLIIVLSNKSSLNILHATFQEYQS